MFKCPIARVKNRNGKIGNPKCSGFDFKKIAIHTPIKKLHTLIIIIFRLNYQTIVMHIRDSMSIHKYKNLSVTNILASNRIIAHRLENDVHSTVNFYICFQHHITSFVCALLDMEPFSSRLQNLREFVRKAKSDYKMRSYMHEYEFCDRKPIS